MHLQNTFYESAKYRSGKRKIQEIGTRSQDNVKVQGMGVFFLVMPYDMAPYWVVSKWFIAP
jgi:hypothetical protein